MSIFKANDIRGIYGKDLKNKDAYCLGNVFAQFSKSNQIIVGRDNRLSSPALHKSLVKGITDAGADVLDIGIIDSPGAYFASHYFKKPVIMITASHNPSEHNGFYLCKADAVSIYEKNGLKKIEKLMKSEKLIIRRKIGKIKKSLSACGTFGCSRTPHSKECGFNVRDIIKKDLLSSYIKHIFSFVDAKRIKPLKVVVDAGNGVGSIIAREVLGKIPLIRTIPLYFELDGSFPNRGPDTSIEENLIHLGRKVREARADFGAAFDGDADRIAFVDERGEAIDGSLMGALLARSILQATSKKAEKIIYTIGCSRIVPEIIKEYNGVPIREKVGHSFVNNHMIKEKALFGIEHTGHYFYRNNFYTESAIITLITACEIFSKNNGKAKMSELIKPFKKYYRSREISLPAKNQEGALAYLKKTLGCSCYKCKMDTFDGLYLDCGNYWFRIRASQTEPLIRLQIEGKSEKDVKKAEAELIKKIKEATRQP